MIKLGFLIESLLLLLTSLEHFLGIGPVSFNSNQVHGEAKVWILVHVDQGCVDGLRSHVIAHLVDIHWEKRKVIVI